MAEYKLGYTGAQIDTAIGRVLDGVPYNLLDNSDFTNPVNQRGKTSYTGEASKLTYTIDRWNIWDTHAKTEVTASGLKITGIDVTGYLAQIFENPDKMIGKTYTLAAGMSNGTIICGTATVPSITQTEEYYISAIPASDTTPGLRLQVAGNLSKVRFQFSIKPGKTCIIAWAALYEGSYTAETLPAYQPKGYAAELAECRRYYKVIDVNVAPWLFEGTTIRRYYVGYEPMRTAPTVDVSGLKEYGTWTDLGSALNPYNIKNNRVLLNATSETTSTRLYIGGSIALSADL